MAGTSTEPDNSFSDSATEDTTSGDFGILDTAFRLMKDPSSRRGPKPSERAPDADFASLLWSPRMKGSAASSDVLVIGGGIMGTSAALELRRAGAQVTVLEKSLPGAEASSAAAGILGAEIEAESPGPMLELCRRSRKLYPAWVRGLEEATSMHVGFLEGGSVQAFFERPDLRKGLTRRRFQVDSGQAKRLSRSALLELEPQVNPELAGGIFFERDARITPPSLFRATQIAATRAGVVFRTGATVRQVAVEKSGARGARVRGVLLDDGQLLRADTVVVAAGSWTQRVEGLPLLRQEIIPARGQIVELTSPRPLFGRLLCSPDCYLIPRADGKVLVGSTLEFVGYRKGVTAGGVHQLLSAALRLVPALEEAEVTGTWSNFRPYTEDHLPLLGNAGVKGLVVASGHYRTGILLAPITAQLVTRLALGRSPGVDLAPFDPLRHRDPAIGAPSKKSGARPRISRKSTPGSERGARKLR